MKTGAIIITAGTAAGDNHFRPMEKMGAVSMLQRLIITFQQAGIDRIVVATAEACFEEVQKHVSKMGVICLCGNAGTSQMLDYAKLGLAYLQGKSEKFLLTPVDTPLFTAHTVRMLLQSDAPLANPCFRGEIGHPLLISEALIPSILSYTGADGLCGAVRKCHIPSMEIEVDDKGVLYDADRDEKDQELLTRHNRQALRPVLRLELAREQPFFGPGTVQLLTLIEETKSVRLACQQMGISYSKGWKMIQTMEHQLEAAMVERQQGGKNGGAAFLTESGRALLQKYFLLEQRCQQAAEKAFKEIF